ncbi:MAG: PAS domain S-box protein, partial [Steroidobacter sp.]
MSVILIAFERESEQSALETLLSGRGHRVVKSSNGLAALDTARKEPPQAIVSDIVLPRMDGFALCRKWKQDERLQGIPFVFYTRRHDDPKYERFALELGAERFLARSSPPEKLLSALEELLPNGQANGHSNGHSNGHANGVANGSTNGHAFNALATGVHTAANGHGNAGSGNTRPMNMLDTQAMKRMALLEKTQAEALERAQFVQRQQQAAQNEALEKAQRQQAAQSEALEKAQRQHATQVEELQKFQKLQAAQAEALDKSHKLQAAQAEALERSQRAQAEAAERLERAQRAQTEATERLERAQLEAHEKSQQAQAQAEALERAVQAHSRMRSQITELEAANQRLAAGEARFRRVFEGNPLPMWIADEATGGFIAVNEAALSLYGYSRAEFLALKASGLDAPGASSDAGTIVHQRKDGGNISLSITTQRIEFDGRSADLVSAYDLTPRMEVERQLQEQAKSGPTVLDSAADGSWLLAADGQIMEVNTTYCRMSGYSKEELLAMNAADIE